MSDEKKSVAEVLEDAPKQTSTVTLALRGKFTDKWAFSGAVNGVPIDPAHGIAAYAAIDAMFDMKEFKDQGFSDFAGFFAALDGLAKSGARLVLNVQFETEVK